jgi:beta-glucosidase
LSYSAIAYGPTAAVAEHSGFTITASITNNGAYPVCEVAQLYVRDLVGSVTRPVKELKGFQRVELAPGETKEVSFRLAPEDLAFHRRDGSYGTEPGEFQVWIAGNSEGGAPARFVLDSVDSM